MSATFNTAAYHRFVEAAAAGTFDGQAERARIALELGAGMLTQAAAAEEIAAVEVVEGQQREIDAEFAIDERVDADPAFAAAYARLAPDYATTYGQSDVRLLAAIAAQQAASAGGVA